MVKTNRIAIRRTTIFNSPYSALYITLGIIALVAVIFVVVRAAARPGKTDSRREYRDSLEDAEVRRAGRKGEIYAEELIKSVLRGEDRLFTNVELVFEDKPTELDNVVVNSNGVFIIEVKNYNGKLSGRMDEFEWKKVKTTESGNTYSKSVKNPIVQVKRQIYILAHYLDERGLRVWVKGYAMLLNSKSPVKSEYILTSMKDIDRAIHTPGKVVLNDSLMDDISLLLMKTGNVRRIG